jgi:hypothetical protein
MQIVVDFAKVAIKVLSMSESLGEEIATDFVTQGAIEDAIAGVPAPEVLMHLQRAFAGRAALEKVVADRRTWRNAGTALGKVLMKRPGGGK